jgi:drug/metabolite transporter (DMT)-like permease
VPATAADRAHTVPPVLICIAAWIVPGAGHIWQGRLQKGIVFLVALPLMFAIGLALKGRLFPFELSQPLVALAALATLGNGLPYFLARMMQLGQGVVTAASYEYGNTFLIVSGLLNMLVVIDAYDIALGRKG